MASSSIIEPSEDDVTSSSSSGHANCSSVAGAGAIGSHAAPAASRSPSATQGYARIWAFDLRQTTRASL